MRKIKKVISMLLILTLIGVNFMPLLNVKAEGTNITTNDNICNGNSCYVTNTANLTVRGVYNDTFSAYKILDVYYNKNTNQFSYSFTSDFVNFKNDSNYSNYVISDGKTIGELTVDDYFNLTSDAGSENMWNTTSTLNKLVSKYATYIRKNNIAGVDMTTSNDQASASVITGAYLILPSEVFVGKGDANKFIISTYGVIIGNVVFDVDTNSNWVLND